MITKRMRPAGIRRCRVLRCRRAINQSLHIADGCQDRRLSGGFSRGCPPAIARRHVALSTGSGRRRELWKAGMSHHHFGPLKSAAGQRTVAVPAAIMPTLKNHLQKYTAPEPDALVFTTPTGTLLRHDNFRRRQWLPALTAANLTGIHFHDLRHAGNALTAGAGATLRELTDRMATTAPEPLSSTSTAATRASARSPSASARSRNGTFGRHDRARSGHVELRMVDDADDKAGSDTW